MPAIRQFMKSVIVDIKVNTNLAWESEPLLHNSTKYFLAAACVLPPFMSAVWITPNMIHEQNLMFNHTAMRPI